MSHGKQRCQGAGTVRRRLWATIFISPRRADSQVQSVLCLAKATGELIWRTPVHTGKFLKRWQQTRVTCLLIGGMRRETLYVTFPNDKQVFLTTLGMDGKVLWQQPVSDYVIPKATARHR